MTNRMGPKLYRINDRQKEILAEAQLDADLPVAEIAARAKLPEFAVRRNLDLLRQQEIVHKLWYLNPFANGYELYDILLEIAPSFLPKLDKLIGALVRIPAVEFITELTGTFLLSVTVRGRSAQDVANLIGEICGTFPGSIAGKDISAILSLTDIPIFRTARQSKRKPRLSFTASAAPIILDTLDERILTQMRSNPEVSLTSLARQLGVPATSLTYRVKGLKECGAIVGARFFIDMFRLGYHFAIHRVALSGDGAAHAEAIEERIQSVSGVYFTARTLCRWDITFGTVTDGMSELSRCTAAIASLVGSRISRLETVHAKRFYKLNGARYQVT